MVLHYEILDQARKEILPLFASLKGAFYLAGGTALALQLGHRDSVDFDFFTPEEFEPQKLLGELRRNFSGHGLEIIQEDKNTLSLLVDGNINLSFFFYPYPLISKALGTEYMNIASVEDIAAMKLVAIVNRSAQKDFVDLYYILNHYTLSGLFDIARKKLPMYSEQLVLKSLVYFEETKPEPIKFMPGFEITWPQLQKFFVKTVKDFSGGL